MGDHSEPSGFEDNGPASKRPRLTRATRPGRPRGGRAGVIRADPSSIIVRQQTTPELAPAQPHPPAEIPVYTPGEPISAALERYKAWRGKLPRGRVLLLLCTDKYTIKKSGHLMICFASNVNCLATSMAAPLVADRTTTHAIRREAPPPRRVR